MADWQHRYARINGIDMHFVGAGQGPLVVLCHGFPHLWFSLAPPDCPVSR